MKKLMLLVLTLAAPATFAQNEAPAAAATPACPDLSGVYTRAKSEPVVQARFTQTECRKLEVTLLGEKPEPYFTVPAIGEAKVTDELAGATFRAFWKGHELVSEITTKTAEIATYQITLRAFDGGIVQVNDFELRKAGTAEFQAYHEVITWDRVPPAASSPSKTR